MNIELRKIDDWEVLYLDGEKVTEGHEISVHEVLDMLLERKVIQNYDYCYNDEIDEVDDDAERDVLMADFFRDRL